MSRLMNILAAAMRKPFANPAARKFMLATAVAAALGGPAAMPASAGGERYDRYGRDYRHHDRDHKVDLDFNLRIGSPVPRCEPVYEERRVRVWCPPVYKTVCEKRWVEPVYQTVCEKVWVPARYEVRRVRRHDRRHGWHWCEERVLVCAGHYENVERRVCLREGHWENYERQVCVSEGHWDWKTERVQVGTREVYEPLGGLAIRIGK
jgi:hypothetical protein